MPRIALILPWTARYSPVLKPNSIELVTRHLIKSSAYEPDIHIIGNPLTQGAEPFIGGQYHAVADQPITKSRKAWAQAVAKTIDRIGKVDVISVQQTPQTAAALKKLLPAIPLALHRHDTQSPRSPIKRMMQAKRMRRADAVICNSAHVANFHASNWAVAEDKLHIIYNPFDLPDQIPAHRSDQHITCVAEMAPRKGPLLYVEALAKILPRYPDWSASLVSWAGKHGTQDYTQAMLNAMDKLPASRFTHHEFLPHDQVLAEFSRSAIAITPSQIDEGFGLTALEAVANGCAIITSGRGGLAEVAGPEPCTPHKQTAKAYADCLANLIEDEPARRHNANMAFAHAKTMFDTSVVTARHDALLAQLSGGGG